MISKIQVAFPDIKITDMSLMYNNIYTNKQIYKNKPPWDTVKNTGLTKTGRRNINLLNVGKILCDELVTLSFSEQCEISVADKDVDNYVADILEKNGFWDKFPDLLSETFAIGGGILKLYLDKGKPVIDYVDGDMFYPTAWDNRSITEGVFISYAKQGDYNYTLFERHYHNTDGDVCIENKLFKSKDEKDVGNLCDLSELYEDLAPTVTYKGIKMQMFTYIKPPVSNNIDTESPLGISVYTNSSDTLKGLDTTFDSFVREFILGKKRVILPTSAIQAVTDTVTGQQRRYFDPDDEALFAFSAEDAENNKIIDNTVNLRVQEHVDAINALLNILCFQTGLSAGTLSFDKTEGLKTATEIISQDSKTARTVKSFKNALTENLEDLINGIIALGFSINEISKIADVTIGWKDNIIVDDNTLIDNNIKLVDSGLKSKIKAIMEVQKCDEVEAQKELEAIRKEQDITGLDVDMFGGDNSDKARTTETE